MPDEEKTQFTTSEKRLYDPGPCPRCGWKREQDWIRTTDWGSTEPVWVRGYPHCPNPNCTQG